MNMKELGTRLLVACIGIPLILGSVLFGKILFVLVVLIIETVALFEFYILYKNKGYFPNFHLGILFTVLITIEIYFYQFRFIILLLLIATMLVMTCEMFRNKEKPVANVAVTLLGMMHLSILSSLILIREVPKSSHISYIAGGWMVMQILFTIWICDTAAYIWGSKFGKHRLFPRISPKKTWEGAVAGLITSVPGSILIRYLFIPETSMGYAVGVGLIIGTFGQLGDLIESFIKRDAGVKDSSNILPGHGGFLDRFDSPLFVAPLVYLFMTIYGI